MSRSRTGCFVSAIISVPRQGGLAASGRIMLIMTLHTCTKAHAYEVRMVLWKKCHRLAQAVGIANSTMRL
jgi:hypothetical protein